MTELHAKIDQAAKTFEEKRSNLYRPDGSKVFSDAAHTERESVLRQELNATLDHIGREIEQKITAHEQEVLKLEHADPSAALTTEELSRANARSAFVADEVFGLSVDALASRMKAVAASGDRPAMFLLSNRRPE